MSTTRATKALAASLAIVVVVVTSTGAAAEAGASPRGPARSARPAPAPASTQAGAASGDVASAGAEVAYVPPVDAPVTDRFRPPSTPYGAGNRGVDYDTTPGTPVRASAGGEVAFAGQVGGALHVVVLHPDGVRTTYAFLAAIAVHRGDHVDQGAVIGTAGDAFHFGARLGEEYIDPLELLVGASPLVLHARLLPDVDRRPRSTADERRGLLRSLGRLGAGARRALEAGAARAGRAAAAGADVAQSAAAATASAALEAAGRVTATTVGLVDLEIDRLRLLAYYTNELTVGYAAGLAAATLAWVAERGSCTPSSVRPPPAPAAASRRIVVLVGGLGSSTGSASIRDVDTAALGYAPADVQRFSYRDGGSYEPADTFGDIRESGERLARDVAAIQAANPGVPVDVLAHSEGGLVARSALVQSDMRVATLVTLATPHQGADLATAGAAIRDTALGREALDEAGRWAPIDPDAPSVREMAATSDFLRELAARPLPRGTRVVAVAAAHDVVVPSVRAHLDGAVNVVVDPGTDKGILSEHSALPGSPEAAREIALAIAGMAPTCRTLWQRLAQETVGRAIADAEDGVGVGVAGVLWWLDPSNPRPEEKHPDAKADPPSRPSAGAEQPEAARP